MMYEQFIIQLLHACVMKQSDAGITPRPHQGKGRSARHTPDIAGVVRAQLLGRLWLWG